MFPDLLRRLQVNGKVTITLRVRPGARTTGLGTPLSDGVPTINLHAPAEGGKANEELVAFVARGLGVPLASVEIVAGLTSRRKTLRIRRTP